MGWLKATAFVAIQRSVCLCLATLALPERFRAYGLFGAILIFVLSVAEHRLVGGLVQFLSQHLISILRISAKLMVMGAYIVVAPQVPFGFTEGYKKAQREEAGQGRWL